MFRRLPYIVALAALTTTFVACGTDDDGTTDHAGAGVTFQSPGDGSRIAGGVDVTMAADGIDIEPAGDVRHGAGHFHVIADGGCVDVGDAIVKDADHVHFGSGANTGTIYLEPGTHTLCLQVGDGAHAALGLTDSIEIDVGITDRTEFCDVFAEADALSASTESANFATTLAAATNIARLLTQLRAATEYVDAEARDAVEDLLDFSIALFDGISEVESEQQAEALWTELAPSDDEMASIDAVATPWIADTCGVELD